MVLKQHLYNIWDGGKTVWVVCQMRKWVVKMELSYSILFHWVFIGFTIKTSRRGRTCSANWFQMWALELHLFESFIETPSFIKSESWKGLWRSSSPTSCPVWEFTYPTQVAIQSSLEDLWWWNSHNFRRQAAPLSNYSSNNQKIPPILGLNLSYKASISRFKSYPRVE